MTDLLPPWVHTTHFNKLAFSDVCLYALDEMSYLIEYIWFINSGLYKPLYLCIHYISIYILLYICNCLFIYFLFSCIVIK